MGRGSGTGGGGTGEGTIGLGNFGTIGKGGGGGNGSGYGRGAGGLGGRRARAPDVIPGQANVRGSLDKEIIRRIIMDIFIKPFALARREDWEKGFVQIRRT